MMKTLTHTLDTLTDARVMAASLVRIVDDDATILDSYRFMLGALGWRVQCFADAQSFLLDTHTQPGCLVLDVRMPLMSGLQLQAEMQLRGCNVPIIFVTGHGDVDMAVHTMKNGAADFMLKPVVPERLKAAVLHWCRLDCLKRLERLEADAMAGDSQTLSERERQVARLVVEGLSNKAIADALAISVRTVKFHRSQMAQKLGVSTSAQLIARLLLMKDKALL